MTCLIVLTISTEDVIYNNCERYNIEIRGMCDV